MTIPEMGRRLGLDRRQAWELYRHAKEHLVLIHVAEKPRITSESFEKWYMDQKWLHLAAENSLVDEEAALKPEHKEFVSIREAAECLGISEKKVYRLVENGTFGGRKIGKTWFIRYTDVASYEKED